MRRMELRIWGGGGERNGYLGIVLDAFLYNGMDCELTLVDHGDRSEGL